MLTKDDLNQIKVLLEDIPTKSDMKTLNQDIVSIRKDMKVIINFFDREYLELRKRIERIEEVLKLSPIN